MSLLHLHHRQRHLHHLTQFESLPLPLLRYRLRQRGHGLRSIGGHGITIDDGGVDNVGDVVLVATFANRVLVVQSHRAS